MIFCKTMLDTIVTTKKETATVITLRKKGILPPPALKYMGKTKKKSAVHVIALHQGITIAPAALTKKKGAVHVIAL